MPYLNWSHDTIHTQVLSTEARRGSAAQTVFTVKLTQDRIQALVSALSEVVEAVESGESPSSELAWELPAGWTIYWRQGSSDESKFLLSHPDAERWVGTLLFAPGKFRLAVETLKNTRALDVADLGPLHFLVNFRLSIALDSSSS